MEQIARARSGIYPDLRHADFGPTGFQHDQTWTLNPAICRFLSSTLREDRSGGPWKQIALTFRGFWRPSARHGYAMDWVDYFPGRRILSVPEQRPGSKDSDGPGGGYDDDPKCTCGRACWMKPQARARTWGDEVPGMSDTLRS